MKRADLEAKLQGVENKDDIINYVMAEYGKSVNELKAENEALKSKNFDGEKAFNEYKESVKDYDEVKKLNEELQGKLGKYTTEKENQEYYKVLKKVGFDDEFIDETIFNKIPKGEDFEKKAVEFLKEKPKYAADNYETHHGSFEYKAGEQTDTSNMTDSELYDYLKKLNGQE